MVVTVLDRAVELQSAWSNALESLREQAPFGSHAAHVVERVAEAALAETDDAAELGEGNLGTHMCAHVGFGARYRFQSRC